MVHLLATSASARARRRTWASSFIPPGRS